MCYNFVDMKCNKKIASIVAQHLEPEIWQSLWNKLHVSVSERIQAIQPYSGWSKTAVSPEFWSKTYTRMVGAIHFWLLLLADTLSGSGNWAALIYSFNKGWVVPPEFNVPASFGNIPTGIRYVPRLPWIGLDFYSAFYFYSVSLKWVIEFH
jgi:hypothetical protein